MRPAWSTGTARRSMPGLSKRIEVRQARGKVLRWEKGGVTDKWLGRSRGGVTSKSYLYVDGHGLPLSVLVTAGQCSDAAQIGPVLDSICIPAPF